MSDSREKRVSAWLIGLAVPVLMVATACIDLNDPYVYVPPDRSGDVSTDFPAGPAPGWRGDSVRVATFNLARFFDMTCDSGRCGPNDFEAVLTEAEFNGRADQIAVAIRDLDVDIVLLQEIENQVCLDALLRRLANQFRTGVLGGTASPGSIDVGALVNARIIKEIRHGSTRLPLSGGGTTTFTREFLELHLALSDIAIDARRAEVIVFVAHFKSKANDDPERRLAEAEGAHDFVVAAANDAHDLLVVLGGDLNDTPGSAPIDALEAGGDLLRVASDRPPEDQATFQTQAIDHLFIATRAGGDYAAGSATVYRDGNRGYGGSDHGALVADFDFDPEDLIDN